MAGKWRTSDAQPRISLLESACRITAVQVQTSGWDTRSALFGALHALREALGQEPVQHCEQCSVELSRTTRADARYCSAPCRQKAYRARANRHR